MTGYSKDADTPKKGDSSTSDAAGEIEAFPSVPGGRRAS